jgi:hypothetical protein
LLAVAVAVVNTTKALEGAVAVAVAVVLELIQKLNCLAQITQ